jgi:hypothetical protein
MRSLTPCPACQRHVESTESVCPFCEAALVPSPDARVCQGPCSGHPSPRLGRLAMMAAGATLLCCVDARSPVVEYGPAILPDSGQDADGGAQADAAPDAGADTSK